MSARTAQRAPRRHSARKPVATPETTEPTSRTAQRIVVVGVAAATGTLLLVQAHDAFVPIKVTAIGWGFLTLAALLVAEVAVRRSIDLPPRSLTRIAGLFVAALLVTTITSDERIRSVFGSYGRFTGALPYFVYLVFLLSAARLANVRTTRNFTRAMTAALAIVTGYGFIQIVGADPVNWDSSRYEPIMSTLGNPNFAAGYVAIVVPLALGGVVLDRSAVRGWRVFAAVTIVCALYFMLETTSFQGPVAVAAGALFTGGLWMRDRWRAEGSHSRFRGWAIAGVVCGTLVVALLTPWLVDIARDQLRGGEERMQFWEGSVEMVADRPVLGFGLGTFGTHFPEYRPAEHAIDQGMGLTDDPHNVPLHMFVSGGVVLGLAYLALVGFVGWALFRGLRRTEGERRLLLAAVGGGWIAYQVQSTVSIDVPALAILHFVTAGFVIGISGRHPWRVKEFASRREPAPRLAGKPRVATLAVAAVAGLAMLWMTAAPLRADILAHNGAIHDAKEEYAQAAEAFERAADIAFWEDRYVAEQAAAMIKAGREQEGLDLGKSVALRGTGRTGRMLAVAQYSEQFGDIDAAERWYRIAREGDPHNPEVLWAIAQYLIRQDRIVGGIELLERFVELRPDDADGWSALAAAYDKAGRTKESEAAHDRAERAFEKEQAQQSS